MGFQGEGWGGVEQRHVAETCDGWGGAGYVVNFGRVEGKHEVAIAT